MCELLGMNSAYATGLETSLDLFRPRGGEVGPHADGWGLAFFEGRAARIFKEPVPASDSHCLGFLQEYELRSDTVIAHIRRANPPEKGRSYANTHPFERELRGRAWVFAHNGKLPGIHDEPLHHFNPMGETDSEHAFCIRLDATQACTTRHGLVGDLDTMLGCMLPAISDINRREEFNFLMGNGEHLFVHAHTSLHKLERRCTQDGCNQKVQLIATRPLTEEPWQKMAPNTLLVLRAGEVLREVRSEGAASAEAWARHEQCAPA
jgi:predicted glutamine amidotransferase